MPAMALTPASCSGRLANGSMSALIQCGVPLCSCAAHTQRGVGGTCAACSCRTCGALAALPICWRPPARNLPHACLGELSRCGALSTAGCSHATDQPVCPHGGSGISGSSAGDMGPEPADSGASAAERPPHTRQPCGGAAGGSRCGRCLCRAVHDQGLDKGHCLECCIPFAPDSVASSNQVCHRLPCYFMFKHALV